MSSIFFTWEDANQIPQEQHVDIQTAHRWLEEVRLMIEYHSWESYDMTGTQHADWRTFLAQHLCAREIIGLGVLRFEVRLLDKIDPLGPCYAFVLRRVDGTDAWVLPQPQTVGSGRLEDWLPDPMPPARLCYQREPAAVLVDPIPNISMRQATDFLDLAIRKASV
jgi:hypothetical protein